MAGMMDGFTTGYMPTDQLRAKGPPSPALFPAALPPQSLTGAAPTAAPGAPPVAALPAQAPPPAAGTPPPTYPSLSLSPDTPAMTTSPIGPHDRQALQLNDAPPPGAAPIPQAYQPVSAPMDTQRNAIAATLQVNGHPADGVASAPIAAPIAQLQAHLTPPSSRLHPVNVRRYSPGPTIGRRGML